MNTPLDLQTKAIWALRFLSADGVQQANSGHPGLPMGAAAIAYTVWMRHLRHNPLNPAWPDRDRFILSGGHGSMLLYSLLHLTGYDLPLSELQAFRQWGSRTPGHPEVGLTPGVEMTTGPLGQGFATGVGMAIAEAQLAAQFNRPGHEIIHHYTYAIVTDGDLMEGVAAEAASLAGHLQLGKLIYLYDDNRISIEGSTDLAFTEDRAARFAAYGWQVLHVADGNDVDAIDSAIQQAKADPHPSLILCRTHIGYGLPTRQDTPKAHGEPPGEAELNAAKANVGWPTEPRFYLPDDVLMHFRTAQGRGSALEAEWQARWQAYQAAEPALAAELKRRLSGQLPEGWQASLPTFPADDKGMATRAASGKALNALAAVLPELTGGSADLAPSTNTLLQGAGDFQADQRSGRNLRFGVREHGMGAAVNGMALHGGLIAYGATFLVFSDYMRPAIRLSALSHIPSIWVFTHDSIGLGEDGPTHQPIEHLAALRAIPNLVLLRPADANETAAAWQVAIARRHGPTVLALTRQAVPTLDRQQFASAAGLAHGAYILADLGNRPPQLVLMASGSEVSLIVQAGQQLAAEGLAVRLVSFPSWELFAEQSEEYRNTVLPPGIPRLAVEAGVSLGWQRWTGCEGAIIALDHFGASAPYQTLYEQFGLSVPAIVARAQQLLAQGA
ncbi:MAG: transketolase [Longilinea sp.]|nr:transketolase [Longilinea sp.]MCA1954451.1 transketolase [Anaerolinea sp.]